MLLSELGYNQIRVGVAANDYDPAPLIACLQSPENLYAAMHAVVSHFTPKPDLRSAEGTNARHPVLNERCFPHVLRGAVTCAGIESLHVVVDRNVDNSCYVYANAMTPRAKDVHAAHGIVLPDSVAHVRVIEGSPTVLACAIANVLVYTEVPRSTYWQVNCEAN